MSEVNTRRIAESSQLTNSLVRTYRQLGLLLLILSTSIVFTSACRGDLRDARCTEDRDCPGGTFCDAEAGLCRDLRDTVVADMGDDTSSSDTSVAGDTGSPGDTASDTAAADTSMMDTATTTDTASSGDGADAEVQDTGEEVADAADVVTCQCGNGELCCTGVCVDPGTSIQHCGACDNACTGADACCSGDCTDLETSTQHCGECGLACADGESCVAGTCEVPFECNGTDDFSGQGVGILGQVTTQSGITFEALNAEDFEIRGPQSNWPFASNWLFMWTYGSGVKVTTPEPLQSLTMSVGSYEPVSSPTTVNVYANGQKEAEIDTVKGQVINVTIEFSAPTSEFTFVHAGGSVSTFGIDDMSWACN